MGCGDKTTSHAGCRKTQDDFLRTLQSWVITIATMALPILMIFTEAPAPRIQGLAGDPMVPPTGLLAHGPAVFFGFLFFLVVNYQLRQIDRITDTFAAALKAEQDKGRAEVETVRQQVQTDHQVCRVEHAGLLQQHQVVMERLAGIDENIVRLLEHFEKLLDTMSRREMGK